MQRISKESIFSDLSNLKVSTSLTSDFDEHYDFTDAEVCVLSECLGLSGHMDEARSWYDGYRLDRVDVCNPWSVLNYLDAGCMPGVYWANTSSKEVIGEAVRSADDARLEDLTAAHPQQRDPPHLPEGDRRALHGIRWGRAPYARVPAGALLGRCRGAPKRALAYG